MPLMPPEPYYATNQMDDLIYGPSDVEPPPPPAPSPGLGGGSMPVAPPADAPPPQAAPATQPATYQTDASTGGGTYSAAPATQPATYQTDASTGGGTYDAAGHDIERGWVDPYGGYAGTNILPATGADNWATSPALGDNPQIADTSGLVDRNRALFQIEPIDESAALFGGGGGLRGGPSGGGMVSGVRNARPPATSPVGQQPLPGLTPRPSLPGRATAANPPMNRAGAATTPATRVGAMNPTMMPPRPRPAPVTPQGPTRPTAVGTMQPPPAMGPRQGSITPASALPVSRWPRTTTGAIGQTHPGGPIPLPAPRPATVTPLPSGTTPASRMMPGTSPAPGLGGTTPASRMIPGTSPFSPPATVTGQSGWSVRRGLGTAAVGAGAIGGATAAIDDAFAPSDTPMSDSLRGMAGRPGAGVSDFPDEWWAQGAGPEGPEPEPLASNIPDPSSTPLYQLRRGADGTEELVPIESLEASLVAQRGTQVYNMIAPGISERGIVPVSAAPDLVAEYEAAGHRFAQLSGPEFDALVAAGKIDPAVADQWRTSLVGAGQSAHGPTIMVPPTWVPVIESASAPGVEFTELAEAAPVDTSWIDDGSSSSSGYSGRSGYSRSGGYGGGGSYRGGGGYSARGYGGGGYSGGYGGGSSSGYASSGMDLDWARSVLGPDFMDGFEATFGDMGGGSSDGSSFPTTRGSSRTRSRSKRRSGSRRKSSRTSNAAPNSSPSNASGDGSRKAEPGQSNAAGEQNAERVAGLKKKLPKGKG